MAITLMQRLGLVLKAPTARIGLGARVGLGMMTGLGVLPGLAVVPGLGVVPAAAQSVGNPFAGRPAGGSGPYGSDAGARVHLMQAIPPARPRAAPAAAVAASAHATNETSAEATHVPETSGASTVLEAMFVGCSAGSFLGGYSAWTALPTTVAAAEVAALSAAPGGALAISTIGAAAGIGCGLGAATGVVTLAAASAWSWAMH